MNYELLLAVVLIFMSCSVFSMYRLLEGMDCGDQGYWGGVMFFFLICMSLSCPVMYFIHYFVGV